ncbi:MULTISPECIES: S1 RNA-binding domain-containing protein [Streptococcus]|uniref:RNA-binding protein n=1 Tax=Streptococcus ruminantium TaxID=1917441 RepID=A0A2Z5TXC7_9STRE|nr:MULTISPECIES: S1 RNA-binding domain-containing protein [Streptococcus]MDQ8760081.1 S1 RNA-binding domain-containing protein [Streptococcus ruminantium]MDQ8764324.1 S1 RNA-binding domain-containing protein [Streptococcus ruminantium]MDQ8769345.1 S1 RNA-binding domain-containing protein [Streptococcus ruminantium]MDQ8775332.1 S1 RNA-binding domain-containing protein [Streptococcus ruminantium]MDQ8794623.1 S1 RNA-binding domain-containing protein [Streptococcus ruminantium]
MKIGDKIKGTVTGIQPYGAFVQLENGRTGLIHISEIKTGFVDNVYDHLKIGKEVLVQVVDFDEYTGKISLSIRTLEEEQHKLPRHHRFTNDRNKIGFSPLAKNLPRWIKEAKDYLKEQKEKKD